MIDVFIIVRISHYPMNKPPNIFINILSYKVLGVKYIDIETTKNIANIADY